MGLCLFANNHMIDHEETRMIDQNKKSIAVSLAGVMVLQKCEILHTGSNAHAVLEL